MGMNKGGNKLNNGDREEWSRWRNRRYGTWIKNKGYEDEQRKWRLNE